MVGTDVSTFLVPVQTPWGGMGGRVPPALLPFLPVLPARFRLTRTPASRDPAEQTRQTIELMSHEVRAAVSNPDVRRATAEALRGLSPHSPASHRASAIFWWVKSHLHLVADPPEDEMLIAPGLLLAMSQPAGDCDDFSMLTAAMLEVAGVPWEFVTIAADVSDPSRDSHVYVNALVGDE